MLSSNQLSEQYIKEHCPHCDRNSQAFIDLLEESDNFYVVCDHHPLVEGHILIIPKYHLSCVGDFTSELFDEFLILYSKVSDFIRKNYGMVSTFEHGKIGQTVFHSHVHLLPFSGMPTEIIPEGAENLREIGSLKELKMVFKQDGQYLFFSIDDKKWLVNTKLGAPRFFRDRFATALGNSERGNWKEMHQNETLMIISGKENARCKERWQNGSSKNKLV